MQQHHVPNPRPPSLASQAPASRALAPQAPASQAPASRILAIETSCDETSAAILSGSPRSPTLEAHITLSHTQKTKPYGGIVPEIVAREHLHYLEPLITQTLRQSQRTLSDISHIAATCGPGLMGSLVIGATTAKTIALAQNIPFIPVNHLEGHALSPRLSALTESPPQQPPAFPYLLLLVSGGHCQLILVQKPASYLTLGQTRDDSAGECLDKSARLLELPAASGAEIEKAAKKGNPTRFAQEITPLPQPMRHEPMRHESMRNAERRNAEHCDCDFSFSGLKSALARALAARTLSPQQRLDGAAALQKAVFDSLAERSDKALRFIAQENNLAKKLAAKNLAAKNLAAFAVAGGVASNRTLHAQLQLLAEQHSLPFFCPRSELCTDNAAMIAYAALAHVDAVRNKGSEAKRLDATRSLSFPVRPRWPLQEAYDPEKTYVRSSLNARKAYDQKTYGRKTHERKTCAKKTCNRQTRAEKS